MDLGEHCGISSFSGVGPVDLIDPWNQQMSPNPSRTLGGIEGSSMD